MVESSAQLTADEEKLYDRQIRLWGIESQKRLRGARLLLIGLGGLGAEVAKNIVLAGIKSVTLLDHQKSTADLAFSQFLIPPDQIGQNRAEASVERAQNLNPHVEVSSETFSPEELTEDYFSTSRWDVVVATGLERSQLERIDSFCRKADIKFFAGEVFGSFGYFFVDLNAHSYTKKVKTIPKRNEVKEETVKENIVYPPFTSAINFNFDNKRHLRNADPSYFVVKVLYKFREEHQRNPTDSEEDLAILIRLKDAELDKHQQPHEKVPDEFFSSVVGPELGPVCAIVGAVLSQEVIKAVSHQDEPHNNMFFFNPLLFKGTVQKFGSTE